MGKTRPERRNRSSKQAKSAARTSPSPKLAQVLIEQSTALLQTGQPEEALVPAKKALQCLLSSSGQLTPLPALQILGEIFLELGDGDKARDAFSQAATIDPEGVIEEQAGGGADKFLWLAQLCEEGGAESVGWFEKGCAVLRREIGSLEGKGSRTPEEDLSLELKRQKLANALCGAAEVYMTDLSWEEDAEARCEALVTEACLVAPDSPEPLQTLASVRISQTDLEAARAALQRSLEMWSDLPPEDPSIPDFPTRISLARLLMEADLQEQALSVLKRLVAEDDSSVEAWYLGGWCSYLMANNDKPTNGASIDLDEDSQHYRLLKSSRIWLKQSLKLYMMLDYEDGRLKDHAEELVAELDSILPPAEEDEEEDDEDDDDSWKSDEGVHDEDDVMNGS